MSQEEQKERTVDENITKMKSILANHKRRRRKLEHQLKKAISRVNGARKNDPGLKKVHTRRFIFEREQIAEELAQTKGKIAWAKHTLSTLDVEKHIRKVEYQDRIDGIREEHSVLVHQPFAALTHMHIG